MSRDPLVVLSRLQGIALDAARRALADRLGEKDAAAERSAAVAQRSHKRLRRRPSCQNLLYHQILMLLG